MPTGTSLTSVNAGPAARKFGKPSAGRIRDPGPIACLACGKRRFRYAIRVMPAGKPERLCAPCAHQYLDHIGQSGNLAEVSRP